MIISLEDFIQQRPFICDLVLASGGFDPIHPGHVSYLRGASKYGELVVIVNGDWFLSQKHGIPFMNLSDRCTIVDSIKGVSWVIPYEVEGDMTVCGALEAIRPYMFAKGGDRFDASTIPEWEVCRQNHIGIVTGVGFDKKWASSDYLKKWDERKQ